MKAAFIERPSRGRHFYDAVLRPLGFKNSIAMIRILRNDGSSATFSTASVKGGGAEDAGRSSGELSIPDNLLHRNILLLRAKS
jgi:hypothetical protein